jgi:hypothetical protein
MKQRKVRQMRRYKTLIAVSLLVALGAVLGACASVPVDRPCGIIRDSLGDVTATTRDGERRISRHFEAGVRAGCWGRS